MFRPTVVSLSLGILVGLLFFVAARPETQAQAQADRPVHVQDSDRIDVRGDASAFIMDAGSLTPDRAAEQSVHLHNSGSSVIRLLRFVSTCPCLEASTDGATLDPGGSIELKVRLTLSPTKPSSRAGVILRFAWQASDGAQRARRLVLRVDGTLASVAESGVTR